MVRAVSGSDVDLGEYVVKDEITLDARLTEAWADQ